MDLTYRHAKTSDIPRVARVFATAIDDLDKRHGFFEEATPVTPLSPQYDFWLRKNPWAFWVAEEQHRVVGYTFSFLRGSLWFLADLFILPEYQGKGIGGTLIEKTLESWKGNKITNRALITPAFNRASVSLYMRFDMLPRQPVYAAVASRDALGKSLWRKTKEFEVEEVKDFRTSAPVLDRIHRLALGFPSGWHNEYFLEVLKSKCLIFRKKGKPEGYSFVRQNGRIGPLVVKSVSSFGQVLLRTLHAAMERDAESVTMFFPGTNSTAARIGIRHGFRIEYPLLFLSSWPMGDFGNYLFYSPGLM